MKTLFISLLIFMSSQVWSQNKMGYTWIVGFNEDFAQFDGSAADPITGQKFSSSHPNNPLFFTNSSSNICDSASGAIVLSCTGMMLYDSMGYIVENGDSLQPLKAYTQNNPPSLGNTQGSLILPKGSNGEYYVFIPTVSDSLYNLLWTNASGFKAPFDMLRYNVVDMNQNAGHGKVVAKNKVLLKDVELSKVMMQACRHANGQDWWLLKHALNTNTIYKFLVTKDSIYGPFVQTFAQPLWGWFDLFGQSAFSEDGKKYGAIMGKSSKLFLADFNRCTGELTNPKVFNIPIDSTTWSYWDNQGARDSLNYGIVFSKNNQFVYISKRWNLYQFELNEPDSNLAWYRVIHGPDTSIAKFEYYGQLYRAPNHKIYIGKGGGSFTQFSVIDNPDIKGVGCGFCRKCFRMDTIQGGLTSPSNMPDYELGADLSLCWPLSINQDMNNGQMNMKVYPNPSNSTITVEISNTFTKDEHLELVNSVGQIVYSTTFKANQKQSRVDVSHLPRGLYYVKVGEWVRKVVVE